jgi:competence protein ComGC
MIPLKPRSSIRAHRTPLSDWKCLAGLVIVFGHSENIFYALIRRAENVHMVHACALDVRRPYGSWGSEKMIRRSGVTLVEMLVLAVLLSVLAVVIPDISRAGVETKSSDLATALLSVRSKIELYKFHHDDQLPAATGENSAAFFRRMTTNTNASGNPGGKFGPYLQNLPVNPFNGSATVRIDGADAGGNIDGWRFDTMTGAFKADDSPEHSMF